jgi:hypothetical protein
MIIHDLNIARVPILPAKANPPLIVDADAVLTGATSLERFQPVGGWNTQIDEATGVVEHTELAAGCVLNVGRKSAGQLPLPNPGCFGALKILNHRVAY